MSVKFERLDKKDTTPALILEGVNGVIVCGYFDCKAFDVPCFKVSGVTTFEEMEYAKVAAMNDIAAERMPIAVGAKVRDVLEFL